MSKTINAGIVTAYGAAVRGGYTGTYEEFCDEQAHFAEYAQQVAEDKAAVDQTVETFTETTVPTAVQSVTDEGTRQIGLVGDEGTTQIGLVQSEGTTQVGLVQGEGTTQKQAVVDKGAEVIASIPQDYTDLSNEVQDLKGDLDTVTEGGNIFDYHNATQGYRISSNGSDYVDSSAFVSDYIPVTPGVTYTKNSPTIDVYHRFATYNSSKVNKRVISDSNTVTVETDEAYVRFCGLLTELQTAQFYQFPQLTAVDLKARQELATLQNTVGEYYYDLVNHIVCYSIGTVVLYDVDFSSGDVIRLNYSVSSPGTNHLLTVVTVVNGSNQDYFVNLSNTTATGEAEITITANTTQLKVYTSAGNCDLSFYKKSTVQDLGNDVINQTVINKNNISKNTADIDYIENELLSGTLGESALMNNDQYNPSEFMKIVMIDNNYKFFNVANIKRIIDEMASVSLNYLELGFGGSGHGLSFKLNNMEFTIKGHTYNVEDCVITDFGDYLDEDDMEEIITYARANGVEIIPSLNVISHATAMLTGRSEFWYEGSASTLDINNPDACDFAIGFAELYAKWFSEHGCAFWNLCADEFYNYTYGYPYLQENGDYQYAEFINRTAFALSKYRFTLLCWNDPICVNGSNVPFINRRLVVNYWAHKTGYGTLDEILSDGHRVINSSDGIYWICNSFSSVTVEQMRNFDYTKFSGGGICENPAGAKFCVWIGTRESPAVDDGGTAITDDILPLIEAFGQTVNAQLS